jgi:hypothetical protein
VTRRVVLLALALLAATPALARASSGQASVIQDDRLFIESSAATRTRALDDAQALGVGYIRTLVLWNRIAPSQRPAGFRGDDPAVYGGAWAPWDALVAGARRRGIRVLMTVTGPGPGWSSGCPASTPRRNTCKPSTREFERFARAVGTRYRTTVGTWSIWNEPNLDGWLRPQRVRSRGRSYLYSARKYRDLYRAGVRALGASGNGRDRILLGETAPVTSGRAVGPAEFLREVFCLDSRGGAFRGTAASLRGCTRPKRLSAAGIAQHPYTPAAACTPRCTGGANDITIASLGRLTGLLDLAVRRGRLTAAARSNVWITEFGFQSNPPNPGPISLAEQAAYINWSEWIAFRNPRVRSFAQYELEDPGARTFNTGLRRLGFDRRKPSWGAFRTPLFVVRSGGSFVKVFGGVRPGGAHTVEVQARDARGRFRKVTSVRTNRAGYLYVRVRARKTWRLKWRTSRGAAAYSRVSGVR